MLNSNMNKTNSVDNKNYIFANFNINLFLSDTDNLGKTEYFE